MKCIWMCVIPAFRVRCFYWSRELEHRVMLQKVLRPGMTVLDIGANIGYYAIMEAKQVAPSGKVIAIEPSQRH